jgi:hypothetical protein
MATAASLSQGLVWLPNISEAGLLFGVPISVQLNCHKIIIIGLRK